MIKAVGAALLLCVAAAAAAKRPVADFAAIPFLENPRLSPKGDKVAAKLAVGGRQVLAIFSLFDKATAPAAVGSGESDLNSWRWVNDDWLALGLGRLTNFRGQSYYVSRVATVSADAKRVNPIDFDGYGQSARVIWTADDGSPRLIVSSQRSIYLTSDFYPDAVMYDAATLQKQELVGGRDGVWTWIADPSGAVRMGIGGQVNGVRLLYRPTGEGTFRTIDRANTRKDESLTLPILLGSGTKAVAIAPDNGIDALYELDLASLTTGKKLFAAPGYDVDSVEIDATTGTVLGVNYVSDRGRTAWLDPKLAKIQSDLDKATGGNARIVSLNRDNSRMLVLVAEPGQPGAYYFYDAGAGGAMTRIGFVNRQIGARTGTPSKMIRYKASDGMEIEAVLTLPAGGATKNLPLILMPHGGPRARDSLEYDWWSQFLADRGYAVVQPNYRGSTGYGEKHTEAGESQWGLRMQDDLNDAVDHLVREGVADAGRVCIVGASYGGDAAMRGAQRDGKRFRCAISYAGVSDMTAMVRYDQRFLGGDSARRFFKKQAPDFAAVSPINDPKGFATPILIMHGKKDLRVPVAQSKRMADKLRGAGKPVEYIEQPEGDHHFSRQADRQQFLEAMEAFLAKHNPA